MGLDMYLNAKKYVQDWEHNYPDGVIPEDSPARKAQAAVGMPFPVVEVVANAAYWRKANAIHRWFVENVQDGNDDCQEHEVGWEQLQELVALCRQVQNEPQWAEELLPVQSGFFFGSTDYDEQYMDTLKSTVDQLTRALEAVADDRHIYFVYRASW